MEYYSPQTVDCITWALSHLSDVSPERCRTDTPEALIRIRDDDTLSRQRWGVSTQNVVIGNIIVHRQFLPVLPDVHAAAFAARQKTGFLRFLLMLQKLQIEGEIPQFCHMHRGINFHQCYLTANSRSPSSLILQAIFYTFQQQQQQQQYTGRSSETMKLIRFEASTSPPASSASMLPATRSRKSYRNTFYQIRFMR